MYSWRRKVHARRFCAAQRVEEYRSRIAGGLMGTSPPAPSASRWELARPEFGRQEKEIRFRIRKSRQRSADPPPDP